MTALVAVKNADRERLRTALRFCLDHQTYLRPAEQREYAHLPAQFTDPLEQHGLYSIHPYQVVPYEVHHRLHGAVGGAPTLQEARNLIQDLGGRLRP